MRQPRYRKVPSLVVTFASELVDNRSAWIPEPQQFGDFVVRFTGGVVSGSADEAIRAWFGNQIETCVAARNDEHSAGQRQLAMREHERLDVSGEMMHRHERQPARPGRGLCEGNTNQQRPDEAGTLRDRDGSNIVERRCRLREGFLDDAADIPDVLPGRELGNDAAPFPMDRGLGRDDVRANRPRTLRLSGFGDDRRRRLVARCFDGQDVQETASKALRSDSEYGGRMMPVSVMIPAMYR